MTLIYPKQEVATSCKTCPYFLIVREAANLELAKGDIYSSFLKEMNLLYNINGQSINYKQKYISVIWMNWSWNRTFLYYKLSIPLLVNFAVS